MFLRSAPGVGTGSRVPAYPEHGRSQAFRSVGQITIARRLQSYKQRCGWSQAMVISAAIVEHRRFLDALLEQLGVRDRVTFVIHDGDLPTSSISKLFIRGEPGGAAGQWRACPGVLPRLGSADRGDGPRRPFLTGGFARRDRHCGGQLAERPWLSLLVSLTQAAAYSSANRSTGYGCRARRLGRPADRWAQPRPRLAAASPRAG
jgi:hypothetical protein